jgi:hypothetical protein
MLFGKILIRHHLWSGIFFVLMCNKKLIDQKQELCPTRVHKGAYPEFQTAKYELFWTKYHNKWKGLYFLADGLVLWKIFLLRMWNHQIAWVWNWDLGSFGLKNFWSTKTVSDFSREKNLISQILGCGLLIFSACLFFPANGWVTILLALLCSVIR